MKIPKRESTHVNVQSCPYNEKREYIRAWVWVKCIIKYKGDNPDVAKL